MFEHAHEVKRFVKCCLWGTFKSGKSRFALSFPEPCVIDAERGTPLFSDEFKFDFKDCNHWQELDPAISWLEKNAGKYKTVIFDGVTVFWKDLIDTVTQETFKRKGRDILTMHEWGIIKRRWSAFLNRLIDLDMNVVLTVRQKDEYQDTKDFYGQDISKKTGEQIPDVDKSLMYIFDFIVNLKVEADKKSKKARYIAVIDGSRRKELPKFTTVDLTGKSGYDVIFKPLEGKLMSGGPAPKMKPQPTEAAVLPADKTHEEAVQEIGKAFGVDPKEKMATADDIKVLMTRANDLTWPDGHEFTSADGKAIIKSLYGIESSKELKKYQVDFLYQEFGKVLAGQATLCRDEDGSPFVGTPMGTFTK
jgi:hypothetical protein